MAEKKAPSKGAKKPFPPAKAGKGKKPFPPKRAVKK